MNGPFNSANKEKRKKISYELSKDTNVQMYFSFGPFCNSMRPEPALLNLSLEFEPHALQLARLLQLIMGSLADRPCSHLKNIIKSQYRRMHGHSGGSLEQMYSICFYQTLYQFNYEKLHMMHLMVY